MMMENIKEFLLGASWVGCLVATIYAALLIVGNAVGVGV
tara:strand:+ start:375 stop:491 length:117 start_codon:yes stop_codon:yes gene_type:complete